MRAAFIPALPPSALLAGMIAPSFRLVNRFCGKKLLRTCGRRERPPALCAVWAGSPLANVKGSLPFDRSLWHGPSLRRTEGGRRERCERLKGARNAPRRTPRLSSPGHAPQHRPAKAPAVCVRFRRGRRVPAPTARAMGAGLPRPRCARAFRVSKGAKGSVCPVGTWAEGLKRPEAGQRNHERDRQGSAND